MRRLVLTGSFSLPAEAAGGAAVTDQRLPEEVREPEAKDPCYLTEQDYVSSGILEDLLKQNNIPYLKKDVMGAGMAIRVGPMLERSRFYVPFEQLSSAIAVMEDLFSAAEENENEEQ